MAQQKHGENRPPSLQQVEELASLIKDNLSCKHLVLSVEEILMNVLQDNSSLDDNLELEPMSSYHRLLLHRLADIFGFAHESVGEGDDRHLILQRCSDSSIPSVLVSDILLEYDEYESPATSIQMLQRKDYLPATDTKSRQASIPPLRSVKEREAAYLSARERIFSLHLGDGKEPVSPKPRGVPVVARRMIAHALGQRITATSLNLEASCSKCKEDSPAVEPVSGKENAVHSKSSSKYNKAFSKTSFQVGSHEMIANNDGSECSSQLSKSEKQFAKPINSHGHCSSLQAESNARNSGIQKVEREHLGAAKRMFAHALGLAPAKSHQSG